MHGQGPWGAARLWQQVVLVKLQHQGEEPPTARGEQNPCLPVSQRAQHLLPPGGARPGAAGKPGPRLHPCSDSPNCTVTEHTHALVGAGAGRVVGTALWAVVPATRASTTRESTASFIVGFPLLCRLGSKEMVRPTPGERGSTRQLAGDLWSHTDPGENALQGKVGPIWQTRRCSAPAARPPLAAGRRGAQPPGLLGEKAGGGWAGGNPNGGHFVTGSVGRSTALRDTAIQHSLQAAHAVLTRDRGAPLRGFWAANTRGCSSPCWPEAAPAGSFGAAVPPMQSCATNAATWACLLPVPSGHRAASL